MANDNQNNSQFNADCTHLRKLWLAYVTCPIRMTTDCQQKLAKYQAFLNDMSSTYHMDLPDIRMAAGI